MSIYFLYVLPILASLLFILFLIIRHHRAVDAESRFDAPSITREVVRFNANEDPVGENAARVNDARRRTIEDTIAQVNMALSTQQKTINTYTGDQNVRNIELTKLKRRLRELLQEYDLLLSENHALRIKTRRFEETIDQRLPMQLVPAPAPDAALLVAPPRLESGERAYDMRLYEDTQVFIDDTPRENAVDLEPAIDLSRIG